VTNLSAPLTDDLADICFIDTETRAKQGTAGTSDENVTTAGAYHYAKHSFITIITYAIGHEKVKRLAIQSFKTMDGKDNLIRWRDLPQDLKQHFIRAENHTAWFAAWNAQFDRVVMNEIVGCPGFRPRMFIDVMAQAVASNLPAKLEGASRAIGRGGKQQDGKGLIGLFAKDNDVSPQTHPVEYERFGTYAEQDTDEMREVYKATRPLPLKEWQEYWVSEAINERGMMVDVEFCRRAAAVAKLNEAKINRDLRELTDGSISTVGQHAKIGEWLFDRLPSNEARDILVKQWEDDDLITDGDSEMVAVKLSVASDRLEALDAWFVHRDESTGLTDDEFELWQIMEARMFGSSATPKKFAKIVDQHVGERLMGQYSFNGAAQTGRFSSRGVQVHNLMRASLGKLEPLLLEILNSLDIPYELT